MSFKTDHPKVGVYNYTIDAYLADFQGKATLPMIGGFMLQSATKHAEERGFGYSTMTKKQKAWVLSRIVIEMLEYPRNDDNFVIKTWVANINRLFTERYFAFENSKGKEIGFAKSIWACIDLQTRKPTNVLELDGLSEYIVDKNCNIENFSKILSLKENYMIVDSFKVKYSDLDINKHLNSIKYIEHFVNIFDLDTFIEKEIRRIEINYISEGHYGSILNILKEEQNDDIFTLEMKELDKTICSSRIIWQKV